MRRRSGLSIVVALLAGLALASPARAQDSQGTDFWLGFPGNFIVQETKLFIAGPTATTGTVSIPGLAFSTTFTVTPGAVTTVDLPNAVQMTTSNLVERKGIHVTALDEITVYGLNRAQASTDAYLGLPTDALGTDYITLGYQNSNVVNGNQFGIVAAQDATTVTITPKISTPGHPAGVPFTVALDQGQTYLLRDTNGAPSDLSGSTVTSDKPISVYGGHQCANIPPGFTFCDYIVEQLTPTTAWGKSFLSMPLATRRNGDTFRILASTDNTTVSLDGATIATLNRGQLHERLITGPAHIVSDQPVLVMQYANGETFDADPDRTGDPFEMMIPPHEQYLSSYTISTPASGFNPNFVNIVAPTSAVGSVLLDGAVVPASLFAPIGSSGFSGAQVSVSIGSHTVSSPQPIGVHSYGFGLDDSYGYPGGLSISEIARVTTVSLTPKSATNRVFEMHCLEATVRDQNGNPLEGIRVDWDVSPRGMGGHSFTDAQGKDGFCYSVAEPGEDLITARVGTVSDTATKTWLPEQPADTDPPTCIVPSNTGKDAAGKLYTEAIVQDTGAGLASIEAVFLYNAIMTVAPFTPGTTDPVVVRFTRKTNSLGAGWEFRVTDTLGNSFVCDPVMTLVVRDGEGSARQTFTGLPEAEHKVTVDNQDPGLRAIKLVVNGVAFKERRMEAGERRTFSVASAMKPGRENTIEIIGKGAKGASAIVVITD